MVHGVCNFFLPTDCSHSSTFRSLSVSVDKVNKNCYDVHDNFSSIATRSDAAGERNLVPAIYIRRRSPLQSINGSAIESKGSRKNEAQKD